MKKSISIIFLLVLFVASGSVFADAGAPSIKDYMVEVTNPAGAYVYEGRMVNDKYEMIMKDKVDFGEKLVASYDTKVNGEHYIDVYKLNESGEIGDIYSGNRHMGYVPLRDVNGIKEGLSLEDFNISDQPKELTILNSNGVKLYEWPAYSYTEIGIIPYKKIVQGYGSGANEGWYYINNNGVHGFINTLDGEVGWKNNPNESIMTTFKGIDLTDVDGNKIGEIPKNTMIKDYYELDYRRWKKFVFFNGKGGYVDASEVAYNVSSSEYLENRKNYKINYDGAVFIGVDNSITEIPKGKTIEYTYIQDNGYYSNWGFTEYEGKKGWVYCIDMFSNFDNLEPNEREYYLNEASEEIKKAIELVKQYPVEESGDEIQVISGDVSGEESGDVITNNDTSGLTSSQTIIICIICALVASATTAVVIILINKKKNN